MSFLDPAATDEVDAAAGFTEDTMCVSYTAQDSSVISETMKRLEAAEAEAFKKKTAEETGLPVVDPIKDGVAPIVDNIVANY